VDSQTPCSNHSPCELLRDSSRLATYYRCVSATKIIGAFCGIVAFFLVSILWSTSISSPLPIIADIFEPLKQRHIDGSVFVTFYILVILIHHWRIFCGISYAERTVEPIKKHSESRYAIERCLKVFFVLTYPFFAALVKTELTFIIRLIWFLQIVAMLFYNYLFWDKLKETAGGGAACVIISDLSTLVVLAIYTWPLALVSVFHNDTFPSDAAVVLIILVLGLAIWEFFAVYRRGVAENFSDVGRFIRGEY
jgi:hypothetical protein